MEITIKKGLDISLTGGASVPAGNVDEMVRPVSVAVVPDDFIGVTPKLEVREGDVVKAGAPLLHDKSVNDMKIVSPVSGTVAAVVRGERRKIERVIITPDADTVYREFDVDHIKGRDQLRRLLMESGLWVMMRQRPYDVVPVESVVPRDIFVTGFDSAPLAPSLDDVRRGSRAELEAGIKVLASLTDGKVYVSMRAGNNIGELAGAENVIVHGPHPAGNAGVQIANIAPVNKGEVVWTLDLDTLYRIGYLMLHGHIDAETVVALTGSEVRNPRYVVMVPGCDMASLLRNDLKDDGVHKRVISGNVLTGHAVGADGYLRWPYRQVTVIPEGDDVDEFMGWAVPGIDKMSVKRSILGHFMRNRRFSPDARLNGGRRAMILSEEYDRVLPMDILGEYLIKAILARDIDKMERLGIYEVAPEDFALPEYVDTSKLELQRIVREGLDFIRKEVE